MKNRIFSFFLACLMLLTAFAACGKTDTPDDPAASGTADPAASTAAPETEPVQTWRPDEMHDVTDTFDLDGRAVGIINFYNEHEYFTLLGSDEEDATMMQLEEHDRAGYLKDLFHCTYNEMWLFYDNLTSGTQQLIAAGDLTWDLAHWNAQRIFSGGLAGLFADYNSMQYVDQSKAYWASSAQDTLVIAGQQFTGISDFTASRIAGCFCIIFNKQLAEDNHLSDPYALVDRGEWTFDTFLAMTNAALRDVDGDGVYGDGDVFGFAMSTQNFVMAFYNATGNTFITNEEENYPVFLHENAELAQNVWDWLQHNLVNNPAASFYPGDRYHDTLKNFSEDKLLFYSVAFDTLNLLRDMKSDFGVIPYPKLNAEQEEYYTCGFSENGIFGIGVLFTTQIPREIGAFLEIGSAYGHQKLIPRYYDNDLKKKIARDPDTVRMIDIILGGAVYDLSRIGFFFETAGTLNGDAFWAGTSLATVLASDGSKIDKSIETAVNKLIKLLDGRK